MTKLQTNNRLNLDETQANQRSPVFLIGAARSGTKFLRDVLAVDPEVAAIPFDVNFIWRLGNEKITHDELGPEHLTPPLAHSLRSRLRKAASASEDQVMLEKTVSNALRIPFIREVFPNAKFVHLIRDGRSVIESVYRVWDVPTSLKYKLKKLRYFPVTNVHYAKYMLANAMPGKASMRIWGVRYAGIEEELVRDGRLAVCARQWVRCVEKALASLEHVPAESQLTVRYEDLVSSEDSIAQVAAFMGLRDPDRVVQHYRRMVQTDLNSKWKTALDDEQKDLIQGIAGKTLTHLGYGGLT